MPLLATTKTLGQRVHDQGIHTAYIGKWHLDGGDYFGMGRCPDGWDSAYWYDMRNFLEELSPQDRRRVRSIKTLEDPTLTADLTFGHRCSNRAIDFLRRHKDEDFLLVLSYDEPHHPFLCPQPYASMYQDYCHPKKRNVWDKLQGKPEHQRIWAGKELQTDRDALKLCKPPYFGCNTFIDAEIGRVMQVIDELVPQSFVLYTSDHGDALGSHCLNLAKGAAMYEEITRIPFLARWPGVIPAASVCPHPTSHIDITPTILDVLGLPIPRILEGRSMLPVLRDPSVRLNDAVFLEFTRFEINHDGFGGFQPIRAACDGRYKLVINLLSSDELYDLKEDPDEMTNLIESPAHVQVRNALHDRLLGWMNDTVDVSRGYYWQRRPWRPDAPPASWANASKNRQREHEEYEPRQLFYQTGLEIEKAITDAIYEA